MSNERGQDVYLAVCAFIHKHGYPPNEAEIAESCQLSQGEVVDALSWLEAEGQIVRRVGKPRSIARPAVFIFT